MSHLDVEIPKFKGKPHGWIQWKGTDVCMEIHCKCGAHCHYDGDFLYFFECPHCNTVWETGTHVTLYEVPPERIEEVKKESIKQIDPDEDRPLNQPTRNGRLGNDLRFDGETFNPALDGKRLTTLFLRVKTLMLDGHWRTYKEIQDICGGSENGVSARVRDLRKTRFGSYTVVRRRVSEGLWQYRVIL